MSGKCAVYAKPDGSLRVIYPNRNKFAPQKLVDSWFVAQAAKDPGLSDATRVLYIDEDALPWIVDPTIADHRHHVCSWDGAQIVIDLTKIPKEDKKKIPDS